MVSTTAFRLATGTVAIFLVIAGLLIGFLFWQTNQVLTGQVIATLTAEADSLRAEAQPRPPTGVAPQRLIIRERPTCGRTTWPRLPSSSPTVPSRP